MTKQESLNYYRLRRRLEAFGLLGMETRALLKVERTLHRWAEEQCNGTIQRDGENQDGKPRRYYEATDGSHKAGWIIPDRETGALQRAAAIATAHKLAVYHQSDPRGCALYLYNPRDKMLRTSTIDACYSAIGIAVCL